MSFDYMFHRQRIASTKPKSMTRGSMKGSNLIAQNHPSTKRARSLANKSTNTKKPPLETTKKRSNGQVLRTEPALKRQKGALQTESNQKGMKDVQVLKKRSALHKTEDGPDRKSVV